MRGKCGSEFYVEVKFTSTDSKISLIKKKKTEIGFDMSTKLTSSKTLFL